jgi:hypothetical protein
MPMEVEVILSGSGQESERVPSINKDLFKLVGFTPLYNLPPNIKGNISPGKQAVVNALINPAVLVTSEK